MTCQAQAQATLAAIWAQEEVAVQALEALLHNSIEMGHDR
jgi:hypothetical protein